MSISHSAVGYYSSPHTYLILKQFSLIFQKSLIVFTVLLFFSLSPVVVLLRRH